MRRLLLLMFATLMVLAGTAAADAGPRTFTAHLSGDQEVPAADTAAQGQVVLKVARDGQSIDYRLLVGNIDDVLMAHLHLAPAGSNGGVVAWLYPDGPPPNLIEGRVNGVLATGTITADDLTGPLAGADLDALVDALASDGIYANVHTPDFPGGEIRGQVD